MEWESCARLPGIYEPPGIGVGFWIASTAELGGRDSGEPPRARRRNRWGLALLLSLTVHLPLMLAMETWASSELEQGDEARAPLALTLMDLKPAPAGLSLPQDAEEEEAAPAEDAAAEGDAPAADGA